MSILQIPQRVKSQRSDPAAMPRPAILRSIAFRSAAAQDVSVLAVTTPEGDTMPARRERPWWWRRLHALGVPRQSLLEIQHAVLERLLALLEAARADLSTGWVQDGWWATPVAGGQQILATGLAAGASAPHNPDGACLVGALIRAGAAQGGDSEAGRAIDAVFDALWESREQPATARGMLTVSSPQVRLARTQALTRWNDAQGRTSDEVLAILDRAIARVIQTVAALPAPRAAATTPL
jgi:hypothetical protein